MQTSLKTYEEADAFLNSIVDYEKLLSGPLRYDTKTFDLDNFRLFLNQLGNPQRDFAVFHVAGTKGKGSTCAFLASALAACGLRVGLYTSPHLDKFTERIQVNGQPITDADFCELLNQLRNYGYFDAAVPDAVVATGQDSPGFRTVFELLTAAALLHFSETGADVAVVETGLGGRLDSTNVFDQPGAGPLVNVITSIGFDHVSILGKTISEITAEKAGILQSHARVVVSPQLPDRTDAVWNAIRERLDAIGNPPCRDAGEIVHFERVLDSGPGEGRVSECEGTRTQGRQDACPTPQKMLIECGRIYRQTNDEQPSTRLAVGLREGLNIASPLPGEHQVLNIMTALSALAELENHSGYAAWIDSIGRRNPAARAELASGFSPDCIAAGIEATRWPGRFEIVSSDPPEILDGAHCPLSVAAMGAAFQQHYGQREVILVAGFLRDKDPAKICAALASQISAAAIVCCTPPSPRGLEAELTALAVRKLFPAVAVEIIPDAQEAIRRARELRTAIQAILIFGSMYLLHPAKLALREKSNKMRSSSGS